MSLYTPILDCRICGSKEFNQIFDFQEPAFSGIFDLNGSEVPKAPLVLTQCTKCFLVQLSHNYDPEFLYGESYGYESGLNQQMVRHLVDTARMLESKYLSSADTKIVVDIASNDGTLLSGYTLDVLELYGIDPLAGVLNNRYPEKAKKIKSFFSAEEFRKSCTSRVDLVTSLSVIYDLAKPVVFFKDVSSILAENGIWYFEQSYLPSMVNTNSYDTVCHEHLLYLSLSDIQNLLEISGLQLLDAELNDVNGGSIAVTAIKSSKRVNLSDRANELLKSEETLGYTSTKAMSGFKESIIAHNEKLKQMIGTMKMSGKHVIGLGASTKGNITLHLLGDVVRDIEFIGEINPRKFDLETPGTSVRIIPEKEALLKYPASNVLLIVLPWHFKSTFMRTLEEFDSLGGTVLWPFPEVALGLSE
jgi:hypothetical protein